MREVFFTAREALDNLFRREYFFEPRLHREISFSLDGDTDLNELFIHLKAIGEKDVNWELKETHFSEEKGHFFMVFHNPKKRISINWPQNTVIACEKEDGKIYFMIRSEFRRPQIAERGILSNNCNICQEKIRIFFQKKNIDVGPIDRAQLEGDILKGSIGEKKMNFFSIILALALVFLLFFLLLLREIGGFSQLFAHCLLKT